MREKTYLSRVVEIQKERGHRVITTGPYQYIRHPMYVGVIILFICIPLALGSLLTLIPGKLLTGLIVIRNTQDQALPRGGPAAVITTLWVLRFDPVSREAYLAQVHPGVSPDEVRENTGWALPVSTQLAVTPLPGPRNWR